MDTTTCCRDQSGWRILIAGTGGQGVITAARVLCEAFVARGHQVVSGQLHGMAQRGGSVQSSVMIDSGISPTLGRGRADYVLGFEPIETVRVLPFMSSSTVVYLNTAPIVPYVLGQRFVRGEKGAKYPAVEGLLDAVHRVTRNVFSFDGTRCAEEAGSSKALNMFMLGCLFGSEALPFTANEFWKAVEERIPKALRATNSKAFYQGVGLSKERQPAEPANEAANRH
jgi:indolepyruvate ferredoxin oxidoreductase beta subunit